MDPCMMKMAAAAICGFVAGFAAARAFCRRGGSSHSKPRGQGRREQPVRKANPAPVRQPIPAGSVEIYVGNLSYDMTEADLRRAFGEFGAIDSVRIVTNRYNDKSKGFGFVVMPNRQEAEKAISALDEREVMGRKMKVNEAQNSNRQ